jgi:hypothetical protein
MARRLAWEIVRRIYEIYYPWNQRGAGPRRLQSWHLDEAPSGGVWLALQAVRLTLYWLDWRGPPSPHWLRARELNVICGSRPERQAEQTSGLKAACSFL